MHKVLIIEDDIAVSELLALHLKENGFDVTAALSGTKGLELGLSDGYDLIILDFMLPGKSGIEVLRELRTRRVTARILMLTSRSDEVDKVLGLEMGADDYATKPFSVREIIARVKAILRRGADTDPTKDMSITLHGLRVDPTSRKVTLEGAEVELTSTEFDLLFYMVKHAGRAFTREQLLHGVWGYTSSAYEHTVNTTINRLRSKIERAPASPFFIQTVWGVGYRCVSPVVESRSA
jgi:DNA-binding response OmpR family regulator